MIDQPAHDKSYGMEYQTRPLNQAFIPVEVEENENCFQRTDEMAVSELMLNEFNPPRGYISTLSQAELDPRNYKHVPELWMKRIPYAGKKATPLIENREPLLG